jgi:hypothetical protein
MLVHPSSGACDLLWIYFMCCIALVRCVLVLRCGSAGVVWQSVPRSEGRMYCSKVCQDQRAGCIVAKCAKIRGQDVLWQSVPRSEGRMYCGKVCHNQRVGCIVAKCTVIRGQDVIWQSVP